MERKSVFSVKGTAYAKAQRQGGDAALKVQSLELGNGEERSLQSRRHQIIRGLKGRSKESNFVLSSWGISEGL